MSAPVNNNCGVVLSFTASSAVSSVTVGGVFAPGLALIAIPTAAHSPEGVTVQLTACDSAVVWMS